MDKELFFAIKNGNIKYLETLSVSRYRTAFLYAIRCGQLNIMKHLKLRGVDYTNCLGDAVVYDQIEVMKLIRSWEISDWNQQSEVLAAKYLGVVIPYNLTQHYNISLCFAAGAGNIKALKLLKSWGADNYEGALFEAESHGQSEKIIKLLKLWLSK